MSAAGGAPGAAGRDADEPRWLTRDEVDALHDDLVREFGGLPGVASEHLVESALARPRSGFAYGGADVVACAAAYAYGLAKNHGYCDGNKRTAFMAAYVFLGLNGLELDAEELDVVETMVLLATDRLSERGMADWLRARVARIPPPGR